MRTRRGTASARLGEGPRGTQPGPQLDPGPQPSGRGNMTLCCPAVRRAGHPRFRPGAGHAGQPEVGGTHGHRGVRGGAHSPAPREEGEDTSLRLNQFPLLSIRARGPLRPLLLLLWKLALLLVTRMSVPFLTPGSAASLPPDACPPGNSGVSLQGFRPGAVRGRVPGLPVVCAQRTPVCARPGCPGVWRVTAVAGRA